MFSQGNSVKDFEYCLTYVNWTHRSVLGSHLMHITFHNIVKNKNSSFACAHLVEAYYLVITFVITGLFKVIKSLVSGEKTIWLILEQNSSGENNGETNVNSKMKQINHKKIRKTATF